MAKSSYFANPATLSRIRAELVNVRTQILLSKRRHINAFGDRHETSAHAVPFGSKRVCGECHICARMDGQMWGINIAIRHFGGHPRG